jgi:hypothetical protein
LIIYQPSMAQCYFQLTSNFNMFSGIFLNLFLQKPKLFEGYNLLLRYKLGFLSIVHFQYGFCYGDMLMNIPI